MRKIFIISSILIVFLFIWYSLEFRIYAIEGNKEAVESAIEHRLNSDIDIHQIVNLDNQLFFLFTLKDGNVGTGKLSRGLNGKYKFEQAGHGTNKIRDRIVKTNKGNYLMLAGRNLQGIGVIKAYIEDEVYTVEIPDGEYYLVFTPIHKTSSAFANGLIICDKNGNEMERFRLPRGISQ